MPSPETVPVIVHAIQLAVAPVFLLTGVAALTVRFVAIGGPR